MTRFFKEHETSNIISILYGDVKINMIYTNKKGKVMVFDVFVFKVN